MRAEEGVGAHVKGGATLQSIMGRSLYTTSSEGPIDAHAPCFAPPSFLDVHGIPRAAAR
jgi:hypothetical protein